MHLCRCEHDPVGHRKRSDAREASPCVRHRSGDREKPVSIGSHKPFEPLVKRSSTIGLAGSKKLDATSNLTGNEHAQMQIDRRNTSEPCLDARVGARASKLRDDVRVEKERHSVVEPRRAWEVVRSFEIEALERRAGDEVFLETVVSCQPAVVPYGHDDDCLPPVPTDRLRALSDGSVDDLGELLLRSLELPDHALQNSRKSRLSRHLLGTSAYGEGGTAQWGK